MLDSNHMDVKMQTETTTKISAKDVQVHYGDTHAIKDVNVEIEDKAVTAFLSLIHI